MGKGELQFEKDASNHQNKEMCGNWSMLLITPTFSLKGQQVIVYVSKVNKPNYTPCTLIIFLHFHLIKYEPTILLAFWQTADL
jgi:hypothetical protein